MCEYFNIEALTAMGTIFAAIFSCVALWQTNSIRNETTKRDRIENTLKAINRLQAEVFDKLMYVTEKQVEDAAKHVRGQLYKELSVLAARMEHFP